VKRAVFRRPVSDCYFFIVIWSGCCGFVSMFSSYAHVWSTMKSSKWGRPKHRISGWRWQILVHIGPCDCKWVFQFGLTDILLFVYWLQCIWSLSLWNRRTWEWSEDYIPLVGDPHAWGLSTGSDNHVPSALFAGLASLPSHHNTLKCYAHSFTCFPVAPGGLATF